MQHIHINLNRNSPVEGAHTSSARANTRPATPPRGAAHSSLPPPGAQAAAGRSNLNLEPNSIAALSFQPALRPLPASHASSPSMPDTSPVDGTAVTSSVPHTRPAPVFANALGAFNTNAQQPVVTFPSSSATFSGSAGMCSARRSSPVDSSTQHARSTPPQPFGGPLTQPQNTLVSSLLKQSTQPSQSMLRNTQQGILFSAPQHSRVTSFGEQNVPPNQSVPHSTPPNTLVPPVAEHNAAPDLNTHHSAPMLSPQAAPISNLPLNFENLVNNIQQFTRRNSEILNNTLLTNVQQNSRRNSDTFGNTPRCDSSAQEQASVLSPLFVTQPQPQAQQQTHFQQQPQLQQQPQFQPQPQFQQPSCTPPVTPRFSNLMFNLQNSEPVTPRFGLPQDFRVREETDLTFEAPLPTSTPYYQQGADPNYAPPQQPSFPAADPSTTGMPPQQHPTQAPPDPPAPYVPPQAAPDKLFSVAPRGPFMVKSVASGSCYLFPGLNLEGKVLDIDVLVQKCQTQAPSFRGFQILEVLLGRGEGGAQPRKRARQQNLRCSFKVMPDGSSEAITIKVWSDGKTLSHGCKHRSQLLDVNHFMKQVIQFSEMSGGSPVLSGKLKEAGMGIFSGLDQVVQGGESSTTHVEVLSAPLLGSWDLNLKMQRLKLHLDNLAQHLREPHFSDRISEVRFVPPTGNAVRFHNMSIYVRKECLSHWPAHNNEMNSIYVNVYESGKCTVLAAPSEEVANELADVVTSILHTALEQPNIRVEI